MPYRSKAQCLGHNDKEILKGTESYVWHVTNGQDDNRCKTKLGINNRTGGIACKEKA